MQGRARRVLKPRPLGEVQEARKWATERDMARLWVPERV